MTVDIIGGGEREQACGEYLKTSGALSSLFFRALVLPIPSTRNGVDINGEEKTLASLLPLSSSGVLFCSYGVPKAFISEINARGGTAVDIAEDEIFTEKNAELTAECTLSYIMSTSKKALGDMKIGIVGYGRIGRSLLELLLFHRARVKVFTRKESTRLGLTLLGAESELVADADLEPLDILVNTAPAKLLSKKQCEGLSIRVLELAPGDNFPYIENLTRLPSLPGKMLPQSAGRLYGEAVIRSLKKLNEAKDDEQYRI